MHRRLLFITLAPWLFAAPALAQEPSALAEARKLLAQGKAAEALASVEKFQKDLPPASKLFRWRHLWEKEAAGLYALLGKKHAYFVLYHSRNSKMPLGLLDKGALNGTRTKYDFNEVVTCVDASTGKMLWTRRTAGHTNLVLDPDTDDLFVWRDYRPYQTPHLFRIKAATGELLVDKRLPETKERMEGLMLNGLPFTLGMWAFGRAGAKEANLYNVAKEQFEMIDHRLPFQISPDEKNRLDAYNTLGTNNRWVISVRPLEAKADLWKYELPGAYSANDPFWLQDDVVAMNGFHNTRAEIVRLNGKAGAVVWRYQMPRGAYASRQDGLNNRRSPSDDWNAIHYTGKHILALGADGEIILLDPKTGERAGSIHPSDAYLVCPRVVGDCVVYCTANEIAAVPLDLVLAKPGAVDERHAIALKAQCLASLNRADEGLKELREVLQVFPHFAEGWAVKADLCRKLKLPMEEADARCRRLEATGKDYDPVLDEDYGLIKRLATGEKFTSGPVILGDQFYVATQTGYLYEYEVGTLELAGKTDLKSASYGPKVSAELRLAGDVIKTLPDDAVLTKTPYPWGNLDGRAGKAVRYKGHYVRPVGGGAVRHLYLDGKLETHDTSLQEIGRWDIYLGPGGPLGHGAGGVYNLDANLAPQSYRINLGREKLNNFRVTALHIASDGKTIGLTTYPEREWLLQIWSHDGKKKLREERTLPAHYGSHYEPPRLFALFDGYLLVGHEVTWVPADADRPVRRFALQPTPRESTRHFDPTTQGFLPPTLTATRMLIPSADGAIYVFDTARFVGLRK